MARAWHLLPMLATVLFVARLPAGPAAPEVSSAVTPLALEAPRGSAQPRLARTPAGDALISWMEPGLTAGTTRLRVATRSPGAAAWTDPRTVVEGADWFVNWADVPSVVPLTDTLWAAHWLVRSDPARQYAYDVRVAISADGGVTWGRPFSPHDDGTPTEHGFATVVPWPGASTSGRGAGVGDAGVGIVWLDGRAMTPGAHGPGDHGSMSLRAARLAPDGGVLDAAVLDDRVCECCPTAAVTVGDAIVVAYRNRSAGEIRDIHVARYAGGRWDEGRPAADDGWHITACPVNGPALAAHGRAVALAWFTAADDEARVRVAFSPDAGVTWQAGPRVDEGRALGRVSVDMLDDRSAVVGWIEADEQAASVRLRRIRRQDMAAGRSVTVARVAQSRLSGYPRLQRTGDEFVVAWVDTAEGATQVRTVTLPVSAVP
jgi:hypothetical protein